MAGALRRAAHWLADSARFAGALFYWNARKSSYRLRRGRGRCPCQSESDDPIPGRVRCDAVLHWHDPARFRAVCPLLVQTPDGWRCSVAPSGVRPFWGRAAAWLAASALLLWLGAVTVLWTGLKIGSQSPVAWSQLAWPGRWPEIRRLQSEHLFARAIKSFREGRLDEAHLMLSTAREIDPRNYDASLLLAQITMFQRSFLFSDGLFMALWRNHPVQRERTAITYHDTLISLGRMGRLAAFCVEMASTDRARAVMWQRSAFLAIRLLPADEVAAFAGTQAANLAKLAPHAQLLVQAELDLRQARDIEALAALHRNFDGPLNPFYLQYQITRLAELGAAADAQLMLDARGILLGDFEQNLLQIKLARLAGDEVLAKAAFRTLMRLPLNPLRVERIAAGLTAHPDAALFRELHARLLADPAFTRAVDGAALWLAATLSGAGREADYWRTQGHQSIPASAYPDIPGLNYSSWNVGAPDSALHLLNTVTFPREIILALLERMQPQPSATVASRPAGK